MDVTAVSARLRFDCPGRIARAEATMRFTTDGRPAVFDLRQRVERASLDGDPLDPARLAVTAEGVRVVDVPLEAGDHELSLAYGLAVPDAADALGVGWTLPQPGVVFDLWMSDLHPGRYLEMWVPAPLCHDRFALTLDVEVEGAAAPHRLFANSEVSGSRVTFPDRFTSLSPMLVVAPEGRYDLIAGTEAGGLAVETFKLAGPEIDLAACHATVVECLAANRERLGPYAHGDRFLTYVWGCARGMEYDGATTASVGSLEHEVFHSWFGRGVKPATAADGWIDEAFTTWYTASPPRPRQWAQPFDWSEPPVLLRPPGAYDRYTPREAYTAGARLFAGLADLLTPDGLVDAMAALYQERAGGSLTTDDLRTHLEKATGDDLHRPWQRWVHAQDT